MKELKLRKGPWLEEEDEQLIAAISVLGERRWDALAKASGLKRNGKSCRLRWMNYLQPCLKHGRITAEEERLIVELHEKWGNRWSKIARRLPGRTDNEIKNYWRSYLKRKPQSVEKKECFGDTIKSSCNTSSTSTLSSINGECLFSSNSDDVGTILDSSDALDELLNLTPSAYYETSLTADLNYKMELNDDLWTFDIYNPEEEWISDNYCYSISVWDFPSWNGE